MTDTHIDFDTVAEAEETYFAAAGANGGENGGANGGENGGANGSPGDPEWGELQDASNNFMFGWDLFYQPNLEEDGMRRWFVLRNTADGYLQALTMSGVAEEYPPDAIQTASDIESLPHTLDEREARAAYEAWLEDADESERDRGDTGETGDPDDPVWSDWEEIDQQAGWVILRRDHIHDDRSQFVAAGQNESGETVFLGPDGEILDSEHIFDSIDEVQAALQAYMEKVEEGEHGAGSRPTGAPPHEGDLPGASRGVSDIPAVGPAAEAVGGLGNLILLVAIAGATLYYLESTGRIDLTDRFGPDVDGGSDV